MGLWVGAQAQVRHQRAGGSISNEVAAGLVVTTDLGYAVTGSTTAGFDEDIFLSRYDASGALLWSRTLLNSATEVARSVVETPDRGFAIAGHVIENGKQVAYIGHFTNQGVFDWGRRLEAPTGAAYFDHILVANDGGLLAIGAYQASDLEADLLVARFGSDGTLTWAKRYDGDRLEVGAQAMPTADGGYIIAGAALSVFGTSEALLVKINGRGDVQWQQGWTADNGLSAFWSLMLVADGFVAAGEWRTDFTAQPTALAAKFTMDGDLMWANTYGDASAQWFNSISPANDGHMLQGYYTINDPALNNNVLYAKIQNDGTLRWAKTYGGPDNEGDPGDPTRGRGARTFTPSGPEYVFATSTASFGCGGDDIYLVRTDNDGNSDCPFQSDIELQQTKVSLQSRGLGLRTEALDWQSPFMAPFSNGFTYTQQNVCDASGCNQIFSVDRYAPSCPGATDGSINLSDQCGPISPTYQLNDGEPQSGPMFGALPAGEYTITVRYGEGCEARLNVKLETPAPITISDLQVTDETSPGAQDGSVSVTATGGTGMLTYRLNAEANQSGLFQNLAPGVYTLTISDERGCRIEQEIEIKGNACTIDLTATGMDVRCNGGQNGTIMAAATGGTEPYSYSLNNVSFQQSGVFTNLAAGTYTVYARDGRNCTGQTEVIIGQPEMTSV